MLKFEELEVFLQQTRDSYKAYEMQLITTKNKSPTTIRLGYNKTTSEKVFFLDLFYKLLTHYDVISILNNTMYI